MMRRIMPILMMLLTLGLLILPNKNLLAQKSVSDCCNTERTDSSCHDSKQKKESDCSKNHKSHDGCTDNCCMHCSGCHASFIPSLEPAETVKTVHNFSTDKKSDFNYNSPHFSTGLQEIWQPPKIA